MPAPLASQCASQDPQLSGVHAGWQKWEQPPAPFGERVPVRLLANPSLSVVSPAPLPQSPKKKNVADRPPPPCLMVWGRNTDVTYIESLAILWRLPRSQSLSMPYRYMRIQIYY